MPEAAERSGDQAQEELHRAQIEHATEPCISLAQLRDGVLEQRRALVAAARTQGCAVVASGSYPLDMGEDGRAVTPGNRYAEMLEANAELVHQQLICGCHIHVSVPDPDSAIVAMNRVRRWLPTLLALSGNSPFWEGRESGYSSFRTEVWARWPSAGPPGTFADAAEYEELLDRLIGGGIILDKKMAYWDVRPSEAYPTLEIRICDVMYAVDHVIAIAALARALVVTCLADGSAPGDFRPELLRAADWKAARHGVSGPLFDPATGQAEPAVVALRRLLAYVGPALGERGELVEVQAAVEDVLRGNGGAERQKEAAADGGLPAVIKAMTIPDRGD
jgi:carboxylate-amine ligase